VKLLWTIPAAVAFVLQHGATTTTTIRRFCCSSLVMSLFGVFGSCSGKRYRKQADDNVSAAHIRSGFFLSVRQRKSHARDNNNNNDPIRFDYIRYSIFVSISSRTAAAAAAAARSIRHSCIVSSFAK
jgi:hypothetical protein